MSPYGMGGTHKFKLGEAYLARFTMEAGMTFTPAVIGPFGENMPEPGMFKLIYKDEEYDLCERRLVKWPLIHGGKKLNLKIEYSGRIPKGRHPGEDYQLQFTVEGPIQVQ